LTGGRSCDVREVRMKHHYFEFGEKDIGFEDVIVVSEEMPPPHIEEFDGDSYTVWTAAHEENQLFVEGKRSMYRSSL
jgi:hypothetical protein